MSENENGEAARWEHPPRPRAAGRRAWGESSVCGKRVSLMCSFGGRILPRPHDQQLRYVGGSTHMVAIPRCASLSSLLSKLSRLSSKLSTQLCVKYQLPDEDLDSLVSLSSDEDLDNMLEEYDRISAARSPARLRLFLFPAAAATDCASDTSSVSSELPDYLFGFDDPPKPAPKLDDGLVPVYFVPVPMMAGGSLTVQPVPVPVTFPPLGFAHPVFPYDYESSGWDRDGKSDGYGAYCGAPLAGPET